MVRGPWTPAPVHRYPGSMCHFFLFWQAKGSLANSMLQVCNTYFEGSHKFVRWSSQSSSLLRNGKHQLSAQLKKHPGRLCAHVKGHGGVKASVRYTPEALQSLRLRGPVRYPVVLPKHGPSGPKDPPEHLSGYTVYNEPRTGVPVVARP